MRCKSCHYSLANLTSRGGEHRCPECGRAFDPGDPDTFAVMHTHHPSRGVQLLVLALCFIVVCVALYVVLLSASVQPPFGYVGQIALIGWLAILPTLLAWSVVMLLFSLVVEASGSEDGRQIE